MQQSIRELCRGIIHINCPGWILQQSSLQWKIGVEKVLTYRKERQCQRCNRYFNSLNLHDKLSRCGRLAGFKGGLGPGDKERIAAVGVDIAIKRRKK